MKKKTGGTKVKDQ